MDTIQSINMIAINPQVRNGCPHIVGTTVTVANIAIARIYHAQGADGIADWYGLTLAQVYAGLLYYYDNKVAMDDEIKHLIRRAEELKAKRVGNEGSLSSR